MSKPHEFTSYSSQDCSPFITFTKDLFTPLIDAALFYPLTPPILSPHPPLHFMPMVSAHVLGPEAGGGWWGAV